MGVLIKTAALTLPNEMIVFLRNLFALVLLAPWLMRQRRVGGLRTKRLGNHLLRAASGLAAMYCFFYAIGHLHLAEAMMLNYSSPLFIPLIAWLWLGEQPSARIWPAVVLGFAGVGLILKPGFGLFSQAGLVGLMAGLLTALSMTNIRSMSDTEPASRIVFYFALLAAPFSALPMLWAWQPLSVPELGLMLATAVLATLGQLGLTHAYALAPAARIGSLVNSVVVFAALLGWALWDERPDGYSVLGILLVIGAGMLATSDKKTKPAPLPESPGSG
jgi:drug/metabolite transporter (DMT)-like permease